MEALVLFVVSGIVGGGLFAVLLSRTRPAAPPVDRFDKDALSTDVINMAHIRVAGIGGLGLVAMAVVVAIAVPRIGQTLAVGLVFGGLMAAGLILFRRRAGAMPSAGKAPAAKTILR